MAQVRTRAHPDVGWWVKHGLIGGLIAGIIFALFEVIAAAVMMGPDAFFVPLRMIGAIVLGPQALEPSYPLIPAALAGTGVHVVLSLLFGLIFGVIGAVVPALARTTAGLIVAGSLFGLALWLVNFFVIAPVAGWTWFPERTDPIIQFLAHTFFFGTVLGIWVDRAAAALPGVRAAEVTTDADITTDTDVRRAA
jgi:hypothetical protein